MLAMALRSGGPNTIARLSDISAVQQEIVRDISEKLRLRISPEDQKKLATQKTENWEAYNLYLKGRYYWGKFTDNDIRKAIDYFHQAIAQRSELRAGLRWTGGRLP